MLQPFKTIHTAIEDVCTRLLSYEARAVLAKYKPTVIAIVGSVGKTSTKDAIFTLLSGVQDVRKTDKNYNALAGASRTVIGLKTHKLTIRRRLVHLMQGLYPLIKIHKYPSTLIIETGISKPHGMEKFMWLKPSILVLTRFPSTPAHVGFFSSPEAVTTEKLKLKSALRRKGTLIVNADDPKMEQIRVLPSQRLLSYGTQEHATVRGSKVRTVYERGKPVGTCCDVDYRNESSQLILRGTLGAHHMLPLLAATAVGIAEELTFDKAVTLLRAHKGPRGRMRILDGLQGSTIVDDTYNASPSALKAGIAAMENLQVPGRKIFVLGDMLDLGEYSASAHRQAGEQIKATRCDVLVTVGQHMKIAGDVVQKAAQGVVWIEHYENAEQAVPSLKKLLHNGDVVYVKGSAGMHMEYVVQSILLDSATAPNVLVRQE